MSAEVVTAVAGEPVSGVPWMVVAVLASLALSVVWMGVALGAVYRKAGGRAGLAWVPVARYVEMARLTQSSVVGTAVARTTAATGLTLWLVGATIDGMADAALAGLSVAGVAGIAAWVMWILHVRRFGLDHALPAGLPVLAAVSAPLWAAVVGWSGMLGARSPVPVPITPHEPAAMVPAHLPHREPGPAPELVPEPIAEPELEPLPAAVPLPEAVPERESAPAAVPVPAPAPPRAQPAFPAAAPPMRVSPYAALAPEDLPSEPAGERVSRYAALAPRETTPLAAVPAEEAPRDGVHREGVPRESVAWEAAWLDASAAPSGEQVSDDAADHVDDEPDVSADLAPEASTAETAAPSAPPVYVEPTPTLPVSPYMRGGAAAPPPVPSAVPIFEMPEPAAVPEPEPVPTPEPVPAPEPEPQPSAAPPVAPAPPPPPSAAPHVPPPASAEPEDDRTRVSARQREAWELVTSDGAAYGFDSDRVLVGRAGGMPPIDGTPRLDIADPTRTVSKSHARLTLARGEWTVEDLGSTNGTFLVDRDGREVQVPEGVPTPVLGRLLLGDVEIDIRRRGDAR
jgi:hypothetical protein